MAERLGLGTEVRELKLGTTFTNNKSTAFHTVKYDFKPASVDVSKIAMVDVGTNNTMTVTVPHLDGAGIPHTVFKGSQRPHHKECVLIIDRVTGEITLEKLSSNIQVKKTRIEAKPQPHLSAPGPNPGPNFVPNPGSNFVPNPGPNFVPNPGSNFVPNPGPNFVPNPGPNFVPNPGSNFVPNFGSNLGPNPGPNFGSNPGPNFGSNPGPNFGPNLGPNPGPNPGARPITPIEMKNNPTDGRNNSRTKVSTGKKREPAVQLHPKTHSPFRASPYHGKSPSNNPVVNSPAQPSAQSSTLASLPMIGFDNDDFSISHPVPKPPIIPPKPQTSVKPPDFLRIEGDLSVSSSSSSSSDSSDSDTDVENILVPSRNGQVNGLTSPPILMPDIMLKDDLQLSESESDSD